PSRCPSLHPSDSAAPVFRAIRVFHVRSCGSVAILARMSDGWTRREFLSSGVALGLAPKTAATPWYRRAYRWGQTNITEKDPVRYDIDWWRAYWKRTQIQAVIINAGGIVAYYPSRFPLHHRAEFLDGRDLFGALTKAAHRAGLFG